MDETKKAKASFLDAIKYSPQQVDAYFYLAMLLQNHPELCDKPDAAEEDQASEGAAATAKSKVVHTPESVMDAMMERNPDLAKAHYYMGLYLLSQEHPTDEQKAAALQHAEESLKLSLDDLDTLRLATESSLRTANFEQARKYASQWLEQQKIQEKHAFLRPTMYRYLAEAEYRSKDREKAMDVLKRGFKETNNPLFLWQQADWQIDAAEIDAAQATLQDLASKRGFDNRALEYLRGRICFAQGKWGEARNAFENARSYYTLDPDHLRLLEFWLSDCYGMLRNGDQQIQALQRAVNADPSFRAAVVALAAAKRTRGEILPLPQVIELMQNTKDPQEVTTLFHQALEGKGLLPKEDRNWPQLERILDDLQKKFPDLAELPLFRCEVLIAQERNEEAEKILRGLLEKDPKSPKYWRAMTQLMMLEKKMDKAEETLGLFEKNVGNTVDVRVMKISFYLRKLDKDAKPKLLELDEKTDAFDDQQKNVLWANLLEAFRYLGDREEVGKFTQRMSERDPNDIQVQMLNFEQAADAGDMKAHGTGFRPDRAR